MKEKKSYSLICGLAFMMLLFIALSWIIPTATITDGAVTAGTTNPIGLFGLVYYPALTMDAFFKIGLSILAIGGFYGVMSKTGIYAKLVDGCAKKFKAKSNIFLIGVIIGFALLNSLLGVPYAILIAVPFFMSVILKLGYSKIIAVASTVGAMLIGSLASTFGYNVAGIATNMLSVDITTGLLPRAILFVLVTGLFTFFVLSGSKIKKVEKASVKKGKKEQKEELTSDDIVFVEETHVGKKNKVPMIIFFALTILIAIVSMYNWNTLLKIDIFEKFYEDLMAIKIGDFEIFKKLLGLTYPFGYWDSYELSGLLVISSLIIGWIYNLRFKEIFASFIEGAKRLAKPALYITIANVVLVLMFSSESNTYMLTWITDKLVGVSEEFNIFAVSASSLVGGLFCNAFNYLFSAIGQVFTISYSENYYSIIIFITQSIYGILMLILPTSLFLVGGLSVLDVSYKEWIKYIWKFLLEVFVIVIVIGIILVLVV